MKKLIAGNWKMNLDGQGCRALAQAIVKDMPGSVDCVVCPPFGYLEGVAWVLKGKPVALGAQDCSVHDNGAYTGDVSAAMLRDIGCSYVILGHSERRQHHSETDETVSKKAAKAHAAGLLAIICVGETLAEREKGQEQAVVGCQLENAVPSGATSKNTVIAYEPVWAIGTGKTATPADAGSMHGFIRKKLQARFGDGGSFRILYGGSMKPDNAAALLATPNVDGGLIGGASLDAAQFIAIAKSA